MARYRCPVPTHDQLVDYRPYKEKGTMSAESPDWACPRGRCRSGFPDPPPVELLMDEGPPVEEEKEEFKDLVAKAKAQLEQVDKNGEDRAAYILSHAQAVVLAGIDDMRNRDHASSTALNAVRAFSVKVKPKETGKSSEKHVDESLEDAVMRAVNDGDMTKTERELLARKLLSGGE